MSISDEVRNERWSQDGPPPQHSLQLRQWLVLERNAGQTPAEIAACLVAEGWDADTAARTALRSLRSTDRQTLTYAALNTAAGLAALGLASSVHLLLSGNPDPVTLTWMLTVMLVAGPIAGAVAAAARRIESRSTFVLWSASRRGWFGALAFCTATVGIVRLLTYLFSALSTITGASDQPLTLASAAQVLVTLAVSIPLFGWTFGEWRRSNLMITALSDREESAGPTGAAADAHDGPRG